MSKRELDPILDNAEWARREHALAEYVVEQLDPYGDRVRELMEKSDRKDSFMSKIIPSDEAES